MATGQRHSWGTKTDLCENRGTFSQDPWTGGALRGSNVPLQRRSELIHPKVCWEAAQGSIPTRVELFGLFERGFINRTISRLIYRYLF